MDLLQRAVNLATAFGVGGVCAWTPALSHIFPDASAVRPHGANRLTIVFGPVLEAGSPSLSAFVWKGLACHKPLTLTASSAALLSHGAPGSPGSADSSPGNMFTAALHPPPCHIRKVTGLGWWVVLAWSRQWTCWIRCYVTIRGAELVTCWLLLNSGHAASWLNPHGDLGSLLPTFTVCSLLGITSYFSNFSIQHSYHQDWP